ncbi:Y-family DNA polymerase [Psychromonas sp. 14N.309.X.WAT.B.A12]|uniref:Y-family DNA polymerase n=1 Tax=Psychromonas sp. 14N.309.X.WAT.B.A12 TaxID=2998322 RepID=UPI0025B1D89F|nr:Y-family DNA polymerase [Psychromonas sp. 14N.309.X.WAT.B.A12]MDN2662635.1 Y-family DNA polymerase [Psychromonas sp. 14N.309.X.WAT.B.A12]
MFALVDANSFYCSAEQVFRPEWRGKPIIVLSNNDGCIVAANKQAISLGIKKFEPYFKVKSLCERASIIVCSSNYELYADLSYKMMQVIGRFAPSQHIYSIDESFLSFKGSEKAISDLSLHAQKIRKAVWKETRLPVCIGIGKTLTLAKVANHVAKKWPNFNGVCVLDDERFKEDVFKRLTPVDIWGIGKKTNEKLKQNGVLTALQLSQVNKHYLPAGFNVELIRTIKELNGEECKTWDGVRADKLQIFSTRSLGERITSLENLNQALAKHAGIATFKARQQQSLSSTLMAFAGNSSFDESPCSFKLLKQFSSPTNDTTQILKAISDNIHQLYRPGVAYYKIGIGLLNLSSETYKQGDLFSPSKDNIPLMSVLDKINAKYGSDTTCFAAQGLNEHWAMRRELLSPQYTTNWKHIPKFLC